MPPTDPPDLIALLDRYERPLIRYACSIVGDLDSARIAQGFSLLEEPPLQIVWTCSTPLTTTPPSFGVCQ